MVLNRRGWIATVAALGSAIIAGRAKAAGRGGRKQMVHHVFFWMKTPGRQADVDKLIAGLETLRGIPEIRELRIGVPANTENRSVVDGSYGVSELMVFDTVEDQRRYQDHPIHKRFVETCSGLWERVVVYDSIDV
ncbi:Dabb family protein [Sphingomonas mollis]|uniref:Dabb family protein n=1 Tax=Sphingomonas mollis TaxID=2795726 RepID=A0ABS0XMS7_9SPHN|nr:Dabb family protein [Sphingomonas sp. BT553]MBJ6121085.1 Dabb family protein [Sphingomonas sp. BT553]